VVQNTEEIQSGKPRPDHTMAAAEKITPEMMMNSEMTLEEALQKPWPSFNAKAQNFIVDKLKTAHPVQKNLIEVYQHRIKVLEEKEQTSGDAAFKAKDDSYTTSDQLRKTHFDEIRAMADELNEAKIKIQVLESEKIALQKQADLQVKCAQAIGETEKKFYIGQKQGFEGGSMVHPKY